MVRFAFFDFSKGYFCKHDARLPANWAPDRNALAEFREFLQREKFPFTAAEFDKNGDWIKANLRKELYVTAFGADEARRVAVDADPVVARAVDAMPKATALLQAANRVIVQRIAK